MSVLDWLSSPRSSTATWVSRHGALAITEIYLEMSSDQFLGRNRFPGKAFEQSSPRKRQSKAPNWRLRK